MQTTTIQLFDNDRYNFEKNITYEDNIDKLQKLQKIEKKVADLKKILKDNKTANIQK